MISGAELIEVDSVFVEKDFVLVVTFNNGQKKTVDLSNLLKNPPPVFSALRNKDEFKQVSINPVGGIQWNCGADLSEVRITGRQTRYSGTDSTDPTEVSKFVEARSPWDRGPLGAEQANDREFYDLTGTMWQLTKTPYPDDSAAIVVVGGTWAFDLESCVSWFQCEVYPIAAQQSVALRPAIKYPLSKP
jgi:hypothetical protein